MRLRRVSENLRISLKQEDYTYHQQKVFWEKSLYPSSSAILCMLSQPVHAAEAKGIKLPFDSVPKILSSLSNITKSIFPDGGYFYKIVGKKKELLDGLDIPFKEVEINIEYEEDIATEAEEDMD